MGSSLPKTIGLPEVFHTQGRQKWRRLGLSLGSSKLSETSWNSIRTIQASYLNKKKETAKSIPFKNLIEEANSALYDALV